MSTGKWCQPGVPHRGWSCIAMHDLGEPSQTCEMCEAQVIRYVHSMQHDNWPDILDVGCICAGHMEEDLASSRQREERFVSQRLRWLKRRWHRDFDDHEFTRTRDGFTVDIYVDKCGVYRARIRDWKTYTERVSKLPYASANAAKLAALDALLGMKTKRSLASSQASQ